MARVAFTAQEWGEFLQRQRQGIDWMDEYPPLWHALHDARHGQGIAAVLERVNTLVNGAGVEAIRVPGAHVDNFYFDIIADYVNFGDTYAETLVYDADNREFRLTSYGDMVEAYEREHQELAPPPTCAQCEGELDEEGHCPQCDEEPYLPVWEPNDEQPQVATLRGIDGSVIAVHVMADWLQSSSDDPILAFSVTKGPIYYAKHEGNPYVHRWSALLDAFGAKKHPDLYVTGIGEQGERGYRPVGIERSQFELLVVAMDQFFATGGSSRAFLDELVRSGTHKLEVECPFLQMERDYERHGEGPAGNVVTEEDTWYGPSPGEVCRYCEREVGEVHGYVYLGEGYEAVYARVPPEDDKES